MANKAKKADEKAADSPPQSSSPSMADRFAAASRSESDHGLHPGVVEALKVLSARQDEYARALASLDAQYLKALEASHDGDSDACQQVLAQVAAVRALF